MTPATSRFHGSATAVARSGMDTILPQPFSVLANGAEKLILPPPFTASMTRANAVPLAKRDGASGTILPRRLPLLSGLSICRNLQPAAPSRSSTARASLALRAMPLLLKTSLITDKTL